MPSALRPWVSPASRVGRRRLPQRDTERSPKGHLASGRRLEPVHLHGVHDTSIHLALPQERGEHLAQLGWAEAHQHAEFGTEYMIYGPRDEHELTALVSVIEESLTFARTAVGSRA